MFWLATVSKLAKLGVTSAFLEITCGAKFVQIRLLSQTVGWAFASFTSAIACSLVVTLSVLQHVNGESTVHLDLVLM